MARTQTLTPHPLYGWTADVTVTVEQKDAPPFAQTAYAVFVDGERVGYVCSQRTGRVTYWGTVEHLGDRLTAGSPSRDLAVTELVDAYTRKEA